MTNNAGAAIPNFGAVYFPKPPSVKIVRIVMHNFFNTFFKLCTDSDTVTNHLETMYVNYATRLFDADNLDRRKHDTIMDFETVWHAFINRVENTNATKAAAAAVNDDDKEDIASVAVGNSAAIDETAQQFSRFNDGLSAEKTNGDEAAHILKNVIKDFACQILQWKCGGLGATLHLPQTVLGELNNFDDSILTGACKYILDDLAAQKGKTTGDYIQKMEVDMLNKLWSTDWHTKFNRTLHITGFGSFDRIATILAAIDDVPSFCLNIKGREIGVGGILYTNTQDSKTGELRAALGPQQLVRIELISSVCDLNWMVQGHDIPLQTLPYVRTILILKTLWMDVGKTQTDWDQYIGSLYTQDLNLSIIARVLDQVLQIVGGDITQAAQRISFIKMLETNNSSWNKISKSDKAHIVATCNPFQKQRNETNFDIATNMRLQLVRIIALAAGNTTADETKRLKEFENFFKKLRDHDGRKRFHKGGSKKRRHGKRRKTRRNKKKRKKKTIKRRRKRGRKTRRK